MPDHPRADADARTASAQEAIAAAGICGDAIPRVTVHRDVERAVATVTRVADLAPVVMASWQAR